MKNDWITKEQDMDVALKIMEEYASKKQIETLGLFEIVVSRREKRMDFRIAHWVVALAEKFNEMYGAHQGDYVTRQVVAFCMRQDQVVH